MGYLIPTAAGYMLFAGLYIIYIYHRKNGDVKKRTGALITFLLVLFIICFFAWGMSRNFYLPDWAKNMPKR